MGGWGKKKDLGDILHSAIFNFDNKLVILLSKSFGKYFLKFDHYFINSLLYYNIPNFLHVNIGGEGGKLFKNLKKRYLTSIINEP